MCKDFECVHDQCGICSFTGEDCMKHGYSPI